MAGPLLVPRGGLGNCFRPGDIKSCFVPLQSQPWLSSLRAPRFPLIGLVIGLSLVSTSLWRGWLSSGRSNSWVTWKDSHGRNGWGGFRINPSPQVCLSLVVLLSVAPAPILSHFSLLDFVTLVTELYELIMGAPLLVASHWVWPIGGTCGGRRGHGVFLPCSSPSVSVWAPLELQLSSCCSSSSCPFVTRVGEGVKAPCCLRTPCCSPHPSFTHINSFFFATLQLDHFSEILLPAENLYLSLFSSQASQGWVRADFL